MNRILIPVTAAALLLATACMPLDLGGHGGPGQGSQGGQSQPGGGPGGPQGRTQGGPGQGRTPSPAPAD